MLWLSFFPLGLLVLSATPAGMLPVPAGRFTMGGGEEEDERPAHSVWVGAYLIDTDEVTRGDWARCVAGGAVNQPTSGR